MARDDLLNGASLPVGEVVTPPQIEGALTVTPESLHATANDMLGVLAVWGWTYEQAGYIIAHMAAIMTQIEPEAFKLKTFEKNGTAPIVSNEG
jgi:hypothetical protein